MTRPYANLRRRDRAIDVEALTERAKSLTATDIHGDDECANCGQPRNYHRTQAPHDRVLGHGRECAGFEENPMTAATEP